MCVLRSGGGVYDVDCGCACSRNVPATHSRHRAVPVKISLAETNAAVMQLRGQAGGSAHALQRPAKRHVASYSSSQRTEGHRTRHVEQRIYREAGATTTSVIGVGKPVTGPSPALEFFFVCVSRLWARVPTERGGCRWNARGLGEKQKGSR